jgi:hypothetical protein
MGAHLGDHWAQMRLRVAASCTLTVRMRKMTDTAAHRVTLRRLIELASTSAPHQTHHPFQDCSRAYRPGHIHFSFSATPSRWPETRAVPVWHRYAGRAHGAPRRWSAEQAATLRTSAQRVVLDPMSRHGSCGSSTTTLTAVRSATPGRG